VCYFSTSLAAAFVETVPLALVPGSGERLVEAHDLTTRYVSRAQLRRALEVAFFADDGLALNGVDLRVTGGDDYTLSQGWSGAIHAHHPTVDGIFYASRHHNGLYCVALSSARATRSYSSDRTGACSATLPYVSCSARRRRCSDASKSRSIRSFRTTVCPA